MLVLGLQGSPREDGNTRKLLSAFLGEAQGHGAETQLLDVPRMKIKPCLGCGNCEKKGFCVINDDMTLVYSLMRTADIIVMATPVYFYGATAQLKALIDRSQTLWSRKYALQLNDPGRKWRRGFLLSVGATKGKDLFEGVLLTAKYFFDAVGASFDGSLTYRQIEGPRDIEEHATALNDAAERAGDLITPMSNRKRVLFVCKENACRSQMAQAFARYYGGDDMEAVSAGSTPANEINPIMEEAMGEKGFDMAFRTPTSLDDVAQKTRPDLLVTMGCGDVCPMFPGVKTIDWDLPDPAGKPIGLMRNVRDEIEKRVKKLIRSNP